jgi:hypothetical protein
MAETVIKKVRILKANLPAVDSASLGYILRYRVVSVDKNRWSHWSPIFSIAGEAVTTVSGALQITASIITSVWNEALHNPKYDIFLDFDSGPLTYIATVNVPTYAFLNSGTTTVRLVVQVESSVKEYNASLVLYDSGETLL